MHRLMDPHAPSCLKPCSFGVLTPCGASFSYQLVYCLHGELCRCLLSCGLVFWRTRHTPAASMRQLHLEAAALVKHKLGAFTQGKDVVLGFSHACAGSEAAAAVCAAGPAKPAFCFLVRGLCTIDSGRHHVCTAHVRAQVAHQCLQQARLGPQPRQVSCDILLALPQSLFEL